MNYLHELGYLAIASRLKNFTDLLVRDVIQIYKDQDIEFEPRWFTFFYLLATKGEMSIMDIASKLHQSHPAINQVANTLEKKKLVTSSRKEHDGRKRYLKLTKKGEQLFNKLQPHWKNIEMAAYSYFEEIDPRFLESLQNLEYGLQKKSMYSRINEQIRESDYKKIEIIEYNPAYKDQFAQLNCEWLEKYFEVEESDQKMLLHPEKEIIQQGGQIFFARFDKHIVGAVAILNNETHTCELTKMAVMGSFQGKQIGTKLLKRSIKYAKTKKYKTMVLCTSPVLKKAINLYKSFGFIDSKNASSTDLNLKRGCKQMELKL